MQNEYRFYVNCVSIWAITSSHIKGTSKEQITIHKKIKWYLIRLLFPYIFLDDKLTIGGTQIRLSIEVFSRQLFTPIGYGIKLGQTSF